MCKVFCYSKEQVAIEDKNNIFYKMDCNNCEAVYFSESNLSLKKLQSYKHKSYVIRNYQHEKDDTLNATFLDSFFY